MKHIEAHGLMVMAVLASLAMADEAGRPLSLLSGNLPPGGSSPLFPKGAPVVQTGATHAFVTTGDYATCKGSLESTAKLGGAKVLFDGLEWWKSQTFGDWNGGAWTTVRIDLKKVCLVGKVEVRALREALRDTEKADLLFSLDGETFLQHGIAENRTAGAGDKTHFVPHTALFETPVQARYVEVRAKKARHQQQISEISVWGWLADDRPEVKYIPAGEKPGVAIVARPIQDGAAMLSWAEFARQAQGIKGWRVYHSRQPFSKIDQEGVVLHGEFKAAQTSAAVYPFEPGSTVFFGVTARYAEGENPVVEAVPLRFRAPFERNTFGDMLAINHYVGGGAKSRGLAWDDVALDMLAETPFREGRWWFMFPETVKRFLDRGVGMVTWPMIENQGDKHNVRNANALGLHSFTKGNEPELKGTSPEQYLAGLKKEYAASKALSPWNTIGAPTCNTWPTALEWLEGFYRAGAKESFDVLDLHTYTTPPEDLFGRMRRVREIMAEHGDADKPVISTEFGYADTPEGPEGVTPLAKAQYLVRGLVIHYVLGFRRVYVYSFVDVGNDPHYNEHHFGLLDYDLQRKPAYHAVRTLGRQLGRCVLEGSVEELHEPDYGYRFKEQGNGTHVVVVWNAKADRLGTFSTEAGAVEIVELLGATRSLTLGDTGKFSIPFGRSPVFLRSARPVKLLSVEAPQATAAGPEGGVAFTLASNTVILDAGAESTKIGVSVDNGTSRSVAGTLAVGTADGRVLGSRDFEVGARSKEVVDVEARMEFPAGTAQVQRNVSIRYTDRGVSYSEDKSVNVRRLTAVTDGPATVKTRFEHHASELFVLANEHVEVGIDPRQGGRVLDLIDRKTRTNVVRIDYGQAPAPKGLAHSFGIWFGANPKWKDSPWTVVASDPGSLKLQAPGEPPVFLLWSVDKTLPRVSLEILASNPSKAKIDVPFHLHPEYHLGGRAESGNDILLFPTAQGVFKLPFWIDLGERPAPLLTENWWAVVDTASGREMRQEHSDGWEPPRISFGSGCYDVEMSRALSVPPGGEASAWLHWTFGDR